MSLVRSLCALVVVSLTTACDADWKPVEGTMLTKWGEELTVDDAWTEYPRPQMRRDKWTNLNGLWKYTITGQPSGHPQEWAGEILVPFPVESPLSGVGKRVQPDQILWYDKRFQLDVVPEGRLLLHFEAVDYRSQVWVNGARIGQPPGAPKSNANEHIGGNLPFTYDITDHVQVGENMLIVKVYDATDKAGTYQLRGKQKIDNKGIWYTPVTGIWQTVWLEEVPTVSISNVDIDAGADGNIHVQTDLRGKMSGAQVRVTASLDAKEIATASGSTEQTRLAVPAPRLWSPASPTLYDLQIELLDASGNVIDSVESYAGLRTVVKARDANGDWRMTLNGEPIFHWGPLDQGWWPDGLMTPPADEAMTFEIAYLRRCGFNMIRKHIKVEPRRYYYHCDRLGMLVWQDQVSGGINNGSEWPKWQRLANAHQSQKKDAVGAPLDAEWPDTAHDQYMAELKGMVDHLDNHPSIVAWVPFNERWGQHRTKNVGDWIVDYDPSRLVNIASGGNFVPVGDMADEHTYPHPSFDTEDPRFDDFVKIVGEFGGHGWPVKGHQWKDSKRKWGYGGLPKTKDEWFVRFEESIRQLGELKQKGVAGAVYTQTTDVEGEINGLLTYDRKVIKMPGPRLHKMALRHGVIDAPKRPEASVQAEPPKPNIVIVLVDDMGFSDIGCYGGEIETPNLDALADSGLRFTQFYNSGRCCPTRASLMTGLHPHQVGIGHMTVPPGKSLGVKGAYQGYLNDNCTTLAQVLKSAGYHTMMTGKWHLGSGTQDLWPLQRGFDNYFGGLSGAFNYFQPGGDRGLTRNNQPVEPAADFYATDTFTDVACDYISEATAENDAPFFLYLAYNAPHWPLNPKVEDFEKYRGRYRDGWEPLMKQRLAKQKTIGLFEDDVEMAPHVGPKWDSLTDKQRDDLDARMAAYAGCIDSIDQNIGKLVRHLEEIGERDNTLILFLSDNGACQEGGKFGSGDEQVIRNPPLRTTGGPRLGLCWANACNAPFRKYKHYVHEGGACTPMIANWPSGVSKDNTGGFVRQHAYLPDVMATVIDVSGATYPADVPPCVGSSIAPLLVGSENAVHTAPIYWEHEGNAAVRWGDYKLVREYEQPWELYDISTDRTEQHDLAATDIDKRDQMIALWESWAIRHSVRFPKRFNMYEVLKSQTAKAN